MNIVWTSNTATVVGTDNDYFIIKDWCNSEDGRALMIVSL